MTIATGQVDVGTAAVLIVGARAGRKELRINFGSRTIFIGPSGAVTDANGYTQTGEKIYMSQEGDVYGISAGGTQRVQYLEIY